MTVLTCRLVESLLCLLVEEIGPFGTPFGMKTSKPVEHRVTKAGTKLLETHLRVIPSSAAPISSPSFTDL